LPAWKWLAGARSGNAAATCRIKKDGLAAIVTVPHPAKDLKRGTLRSIERASGVSLIKD